MKERYGMDSVDPPLGPLMDGPAPRCLPVQTRPTRRLHVVEGHKVVVPVESRHLGGDAKATRVVGLRIRAVRAVGLAALRVAKGARSHTPQEGSNSWETGADDADVALDGAPVSNFDVVPWVR